MAVGLVFVASAAQAQTVVATIDLAGLGFGKINTPRAVDIDGDPLTREWLIHAKVAAPLPAHERVAIRPRNRYRVVAERDGSLCVGAWFFAGPVSTAPDAAVEVQRVGLVDMLVANPADGYAYAIGLDTPACP